MSRAALFIFIIISTFTIACSSSSSDEQWSGSLTDGGYPDIAGEYSMDREAYTVACNFEANIPETAAVLGVPVSITQDEDKFTFKYFLLNPEDDTIKDWTQDCTLETDGNFTCTETFTYVYAGTQYFTITVEGYFTPGGMVGAVKQTNTSAGAECGGEYGISLSAYPDIAGEYSMDRDAYTLSCEGGDTTYPAALGVPVSITQDRNKFTAKYFAANPDADLDITNWTQKCTLDDGDGNFTCTEGYDYDEGLVHVDLTIKGYFTTDGMVGVVNQTTTNDDVPCTVEYGISLTLTGYPTVAGEYSMDRDAYTLSCEGGEKFANASESEVPVAITQYGNKFTAKYFLHNANDVKDWTQDCTLEIDGNFTCTEGYDYNESLHYDLTVEGSFTPGGMVGRAKVTTTEGNATCETGEEGFGISLTTR